jgi:hypothetical protein
MRIHRLLASGVSLAGLLGAGCTCHPLFHKSPPPAVVSSSPVCCTPGAPGYPEPVPPVAGAVPPYAPPPAANINGIPR